MEKRDELWPRGPCFYYDTALFPPGTDSFCLAYFACPSRGDTVCDLGSGIGLLGTLLLARQESLFIENVELSAPAAVLARKTFAENGWADRAAFHEGDLRDASVLPKAGSIDYVISNPPYFPAGQRRERQRRSAPNRARGNLLHAGRRLRRGAACAALWRALHPRSPRRAPRRRALRHAESRHRAQAPALSRKIAGRRALAPLRRGKARRQKRPCHRAAARPQRRGVGRRVLPKMKKAALFRRPNSFIILKRRINRKHFLPIFE